MIPNLKPETQQKLLWLAYGYKAQKMLTMINTIEYTLEVNEYQPLEGHPNIYRDEYQILEAIYWEANPKGWEKFEKIEKEYYQRNKSGEYDEEKQGELIRMYDQLYETGSCISTSTSEEVEEMSEENDYTSPPSIPSETEGKGETSPRIVKWNEEQRAFALKIASLILEGETFQKIFSEMYITPGYENLKKWYRENLTPGHIDKLEKAETKWLAEKIEIENSEEDFNTNEKYWEDEYYAYLSNPENEEGQPEYFEGYHKADKQLKEIGGKMEVKKPPPPPLHIAEVSNPPASRCPEAVPMQLDGQADNSIEKMAKASPEQIPPCLYPKIVVKTQPDRQVKGKETLKSLPQIDGPTDPSSEDESIEKESPITKGKTKNKVKRRKLIKSPNVEDIQEDANATIKAHIFSTYLHMMFTLEHMKLLYFDQKPTDLHKMECSDPTENSEASFCFKRYKIFVSYPSFQRMQKCQRSPL
ncbi:hypothetical protein JTB14_032164 [Gonioctena quinquepunctata]|nr:hypothetical protein JTB14_032164 [Gonioctena quinquepunctata]